VLFDASRLTLRLRSGPPIGRSTTRRRSQGRSWNFGDQVADCYMDVATDSQAPGPEIRKGEIGFISDATQCRVEPIERRTT
jgi:hypothetical protein